MARSFVYRKTTTDVLPFTFDWSDWALFTTFPITSGTITATPSGLTIGSVTVSGGNKVSATISGGTNGTTYRVICTASTASGFVKQFWIDLVVSNS